MTAYYRGAAGYRLQAMGKRVIAYLRIASVRVRRCAILRAPFFLASNLHEQA
ncbi:Uncharacterised protein [Ectopseudomonas oleovorans]|uniref:Uncharacterized protein n=1 Tax=Ectopseudomonas oleovorans TaxID=301 RepID=A0A379K219_ECTOL|nr:Uncharacterised protein [Pseudomonas oleovorans]